MRRLDRLGLRLARPLSLHLALRLGDLEGRTLQRIGRRGPSDGEVQELFGFTPAEASRVARALWGLSTRTRNLRAKARDSLLPIRKLVEVVSDGAVPLVRGPAAFVAAPWGPLAGGMSVLVERTDALFLLNLAPAQGQSWGMELLRPGWHLTPSAAALKTAVDHLRGGGAAVLALLPDPRPGAIECRWFGRRLLFPRGAAALARQGRAPLIPVTCSWGRGRRPLEVRFHQPCSPMTPSPTPEVETPTCSSGSLPSSSTPSASPLGGVTAGCCRSAAAPPASASTMPLIYGSIGTRTTALDAVRAMAGAWPDLGNGGAELLGPSIAVGTVAVGPLDGAAEHAWSTQGSVTVVADMRLDNRVELSARLGLDPSVADLSLVHAAWRRWKREFAIHLEGDFAVVVWDAEAGELCCARDVIGAQPLYYWAEAGSLVFSSELAGVLAHPDCRRRLDRTSAINHCLVQHHDRERTLFEGVRRLAGGTRLVGSPDRGLAVEEVRRTQAGAHGPREPRVVGG